MIVSYSIRRIMFSMTIAGSCVVFASVLPAQTSARPPETNDTAIPVDRNKLTLPGAVTEPPAWLVKDAPFDVKAFFKAPPPEENAAPLYLDALYEFDDEMGVCFPPDERARRSPVAKKRKEDFSRLCEAWKQNPDSVDPAEMDKILSEFDTGYAKLAQAQKRKQCVFPPAIRLFPTISHVHAIRAASRVNTMWVAREISQGRFDQAFSKMRVMWRLAYDLQTHGETESYLTSTIVRYFVLTEDIPCMLASPHLTAEHCDRILKLLTRHEPRKDAYIPMMQSEYLRIRQLLHHAETSTGMFGPDVPPSKRALRILDVFFGPTGKTNTKDALKSIPRERFQNEVKMIAKWYRSFASAPHNTLQEHLAAFEKANKLVESGRLFPIGAHRFLSAAKQAFYATARIDATLGGTRCLVALKRWELDKGTPLPDLKTVVRAAGMDGVPIDPYSQQPLRMTTIDGRPVVYSVGQDGIDDQARIEWKIGNKNPRGDLIFRLPKPREGR
ncbi:MAG: hypothetical protein JW818_01830 [Pirellulales bacterium]|nr:hypothetical protein [Pirellulales bacterium]